MLANYKHNRMSIPIQLSKTINAPTYIYKIDVGMYLILQVDRLLIH